MSENEIPARDWRAEAAERDAGIDAMLARLGITMTAEFVPYSRADKSNSDPKKPWECITHRCKVTRGDAVLWNDEYHQGIGHLPGWLGDQSRRTLDKDAAIKEAIETGRYAPARGLVAKKRIEPPALRDVFHCILSDASAIDEGGFENWAASLGYDVDSRRAEKIYRQCVEIGLRLRAMLGETALAELRDAFQDY